MKHISSGNLVSVLKTVEDWIHRLFLNKEEGFGIFVEIINYIISAAKVEDEEELEKVILNIGGEVMGTLVQKYIEQGRIEGKRLGIMEGKKLGIVEGEKAGQRKGILKGIKLLLKVKFRKKGILLMNEINGIEDLSTLEELADFIKSVESVDKVKTKIQTLKEE